ncbi:Bystin-domain-containing protein [Cladochytrium replicatum]|nr:Bystin-domain-containing protein [Cladochytrium replicatum]
MKETKQRKFTNRHDPLGVQLQRDDNVEIDYQRRQRRKEKRSARDTSGLDVLGIDDESKPATQFIDEKTSSKILNLLREQQLELEEPARDRVRRSFPAPVSSFDADDMESGEEFDDSEPFDDDGDGQWDVDPSDYALIEKFMVKEPAGRVSLTEKVLERIEASKREADIQLPEETLKGLHPKVIESYTKVGLLLSRYKSGKLPQIFKIIPSFPNWEEIIFLTRPDNWTTQAVYQATRIFSSNLKDKMAQRFYTLILLERVRDDIRESKKLNYHLYMSLKKALYKPKAFYSGLLLPLCRAGSCTLREAVIIGSVISKVSIPPLHSAAALLKIADMDYTGSNSLFIRIILDKKYALPYQVIDSLVFHFIRLKEDTRELPVLWHQSLLVFSQRYKEYITTEQKEALLVLIKSKTHPAITPEIRRELQNSKSREDEMMLEIPQSRLAEVTW